MQRQSSADKVLNLARQKLGEKPAAKKREDSAEEDLNAYLSTLRKKTNATSSVQQEGKKRNFSYNLSDISDLSEDRPATNKFLKKKPKAPTESANERKTPLKESNKSAGKKSKMTVAKGDNFVANVNSSALSSAANLINKHQPKSTIKKEKSVERIKLPISDSEFEFSFSQSTSTGSKKKREKSDRIAAASPPRPISSSASSSKPSTPEGVNLYQPSSRANLSYLTDDDSTSPGRGGARFLKKNKRDGPAVPPLLNMTNEFNRDEVTTPKTPDRIRFSDEILENHSKKRMGRGDDSDDDLDTADLVDGLSSAMLDTPKKPNLKKPTTPPSPKKRVTIHENLSEESSLEEFALDDMMVVRPNYSDDDDDSGPAMNLVMDFAELESSINSSPATKTSKKNKSKTSEISSSIKGFGVLKFDLSGDEEDSSDKKSSTQNILQIFSDDEIETHRDIETSQPDSDHELIPEEIGAPSPTPRLGQTSVNQYSEDFESIKEAPPEEIETATSDHSHSEHTSSSPSSESSESEHGSQIISISRAESVESSEIITPGRRIKIKSKRSIDIKRSERGLSFKWNPSVSGTPKVPEELGMNYVDPSPIAQYAVSAEALEAVTCYNPCTIVLNDMIKQQLAMTRSFMAQQKLLHDAMLNTIHSGYRYTTVDDTRAYIKKNRPKRMTFKEAMKEVDREMNGL